MIVTHIDGRAELLTDYKALQRKRKVNGEYSLSFLLIKTDRNEHSFPLTVEESLIDYDGQTYRIKDMSEKTIGDTPVKQVRADHIFFDLVDTFQYNTIDNTQTLSSSVAFALQGTGYTFEVIDSFSNAVFENFGNDTSLSLVQKALNTFRAEVEINNKHLRFYQQTGPETDIQFRFKHNIKTIEKYVNTNNLSTTIKGYGKKNEDGSYDVTAEYTSPKASVYGIRHAKPVYDERYTIHSELLNRIKSELVDTPEVSFKVDGVELKKAGVLSEQIDLGARVFVIYEPLNIDIKARVMEIVDFPESNTPAQYTFENFQNSITDTLADFQKTKDNVDGILNGERKLPYNVLDDAVIRATEALKSAQTELSFDNGILAVDPTNPNRLVLLNSKGIGISNNGGATFKEAITADGFVLSAGAIGQLKANNIDIGDVVNNINGGSTQISGGIIRITDNGEFQSTNSAAADAKRAAEKAQTDANNANSKLSDIAADDKLTPDEKLEVQKEWVIIQGEFDIVKSQAGVYSISTTTYVNAYNSLNLYITPLLSNMTNTNSIVRDTFNGRFKTYYDEKVKLLKLLSDKAKQIADSAKTAADEANGVVTLWKYPGTTMIDGGNIYTNSITTNSLQAGMLTGFTIQTNSNVDKPRITMGNDKLIAQKGASYIELDSSADSGFNVGYPRITFKTEGTNTLGRIGKAPNGEMDFSNDFYDIYISAPTVNIGTELRATLFYCYNDAEIQGDFNVRGTKNASVPTSIGNVNISAYETAEYYFGDIGRGEVVNGECVIEIESLFKETVNTNIDYEVFLTPYGKGLIYVDEMTPDHFVIKGDNIPFAYEIKAKRKGYETVRLELTHESEVS